MERGESRGGRAAGSVLLAVQGLSYSYDGRRAVDDVALSVRRGEVFGLLGPNGAGKTTAIGCMSGLLAPASGALTFDGRPFAPRGRAADRALIGVVPQEIALYDGLTARENLALFAELHRVADVSAAVARGLELSGLAARADERVAKFSGGMKRRLNLAVAMLHDPPLTLLDEPMVGVDPQSRHHILATIESLRGAGRAMVYTSHSMDEVQRLCDRLAILDHGRVVAAGTAAGIAAEAGMPGADLEATFLHLTGRSLRDDPS